MILTREYSPELYRCHDGSYGDDKSLTVLHDTLWTLIDHVSDKLASSLQCKILSGYRSPEWNKRVGGEPNSLHMASKAADIMVIVASPADVAMYAEYLQAAGKIPLGGVGRYKTFTHIDVRGTMARWRQSKK